MLTAAAVCPHPPLLIPATTGGPAGPGDAELARLRQACDAAVAALAASRPDVLVVVGGAERTARFPPDAAGSLRDFGVAFTIGEGPPALPLSLTVGRWLLARTRPGPVQLQAVAASASPDECLALGADLAAQAPRVAMLAMGDGPARRARGVPGAQDPAADLYDERVADSLATADLSLLERLDPAQDAELFVAGRAAWQVLAGAARQSPHGPQSPQSPLRAELRYVGAPFEVTYFAANLRLAQAH